jgi:chromosomal replication initiation ATPase DnaA
VTGQLIFDLPLNQGWQRDAFLVTPATTAALAAVEGWKTWADKRLLLVGPYGSGKTHLAHIWAEMAQALWIDPADLHARLDDIAPEACVILDDAQRVAGRAEEALFHLYNRLAPHGRLLLTAPTAPRDWGLALPDLLSRLQAMPTARLEPPDDDLLAGVLVKLFADRQITAEARLIPYLLPRMERSIAAAQALVAALDARSLATHRPVTRALAAEVLDSAAPE